MIIQKFFNNITTANKAKSGFYFELIIQNILRSYLSKQRKTFTTEQLFGGRFSLDGYAKDGIDEYNEPVAFEIKYGSRMGFMQSRKTFDSFLYFLRETNTKHIILICPEISSQLSLLIETEPRIILWDSNKINELIKENIGVFEDTVKNLFKLDIETTIAKTDNDWKKTRLNRLNDIKETYKKEGLSFLLGAGVSCSAGFPDWETLLNSLYSNYVSNVFTTGTISEEALRTITNKFIGINKNSTLATARYLKAGLSENDNDCSFLKAVQQALYGSTTISSPLVNSIIKLCAPKRSGTKVKSIITYNFDNLIEEKMDDLNLEYKTICTDKEQYSTDELPIYHVHGYIPRNQNLDKDTYLVFSEEAYHKVYSEPYHWSNLVQLSTLRENNCLMIGLSLSDPNLRRLLEIAAQKYSENNRHYTFMQRLDINSIIGADNNDTMDMVSANKILLTHHIIQEKMMSSLGVNIIWFENYNDIPLLLDSIKDVS